MCWFDLTGRNGKGEASWGKMSQQQHDGVKKIIYIYKTKRAPFCLNFDNLCFGDCT